MDLELWGKLLVILLLVAGNAFFVGSEIAITSARRSRIKQLADMGNKSARTVQLLHEEPERFYSVTQIGITLVSLGLGAIGMDTISKLMDPMFEAGFALFSGGKDMIDMAHVTSFAAAFVIISFLHVVAGELAPKVLAFHKAEAMSMGVGWLINGMYVSFKWVVWIMNKSSDGLLWVCGQRNLGGGGHEGHFSMSEEEIRMILSASEREGMLNPEETKMIRGVFNLDEQSVRSAMVPRTDILALSQDATLTEALQFFKEEPHARFPVYDGNLDKIKGVVAMKELLSVIAESQDVASDSQRPVGEFVHPAYIVPNSKPLSELLKEFKKSRQQMAVVIDEYGGTEGIITLEDILEEIVGEYADEFTAQQSRRVKKLAGSQWMIDASVRVADLEPVVNYPFPLDEDYITLGGLMYKLLGRVPLVGDRVDLTAVDYLEVVEMDGHRITKVLFSDGKLDDKGKVVLAQEAQGTESLEESGLVPQQAAP